MSENLSKNQTLPAFVIGLERNKLHYERAIQELAQIGINATLWQGVDGRNAVLQEGESVQKWWFRLVLGVSPSQLPGVIGCYLSHYRLFKHILSQGYERAVIFEDDITPKPALVGVIEQIAKLPKDYGLIQLWNYRAEQGESVRQIATECGSLGAHGTLYRPFVAGFGTVAYVIQRDTILRLLPQMMPLRRGLDNFLFKPWKTGVDYYFVSPCPVETDRQKPSSVSETLPLRHRAELLFIRRLLTPVRYIFKLYNKRLIRRYLKNLDT